MSSLQKSIYNIFDKTIVQIFIVIILVLPAALVAACQYNAALKLFFSKHSTLGFIFMLLPVVLTIGNIFARNLKKHQPEYKEIARFVACINNIIGAKMKRLGEAVKRLSNSKTPLSVDQLIYGILKPKEQIYSITEQIWYLYSLTNNKENIKIRVSLAKMGEKHIDHIESSYPNDAAPRSEIAKLQVDTCSMTIAKSTRKILIIDDIKKEGRKKRHSKFVVTDPTRSDEEGSMICYPVDHHHLKKVPFVINVCASEKHFFSKKDEEKHKYILEQFAKRICLEFSLITLNEEVKH